MKKRTKEEGKYGIHPPAMVKRFVGLKQVVPTGKHLTNEASQSH